MRSAGILLWASIGNLLVGDWLSGPILGGCRSAALDDSFDASDQQAALVSAPLSVIAIAAISLLLGVFAFALIGNWA